MTFPVYRFGPFSLDLATLELRRGHRSIPLQPKVQAVLRYLVEHADRAISKDELLAEIWPGVVVGDEALRRAVSQLRQSLGEPGDRQSLLRTVRGHGYRLSAPVSKFESRSSAGAATSSIPGAIHLLAETAFAGRLDELALLEDAWVKPLASPRCIFISGEPGIGKSRLAAEFALRAASAPVLVLAGRCRDSIRAPYEPFIEALLDLIQRTPGEQLPALLGEQPQELLRIAPELARALPALPAPVRSEPETERYWLHRAVISWLASCARERPTLLVLDDLQWASTPTLALLEDVLTSEHQPGFLVLALHRPVERPEPLATRLGPLQRAGTTERIELRGLSAAEIGELMALHGVSDTSDLVQRRTGGNPLFVLELLRAGEGATPPVAVQHLVEARVMALGPDAASALEAAAVLGASFDPRVVPSVSGLDEQAAVQALDTAERAGLLRPDPDRRLADHFSHDLVREALLERIPRHRRALLHRRALRAIEESGRAGASLADLARHAADGGDRRRAISYHVQLGEWHLHSLAPAQAADAFGAAIAWIDGDHDGALPAERCDALIGLATAQGRSGHPDHWETARTACRGAAELADPERCARAALAIGRPSAGGFGSYRSWRLEALRLASRELPEDHPLHLEARAALFSDLQYDGLAHGDRIAMGAELEGRAERAGDERLLARVLGLRFYSFGELDERATRLEITERLIAITRRIADPALSFLATTLGSRARFTAGRPAEAFELLDGCLALADTTGLPHARGMARHLVANQLRMRGRLARSAELVAEAHAIQCEGGLEDADLMRTFASLAFDMERGALAPRADELGRLSTAVPRLAELRATWALALCEAGRFDEACDVLDRLVAQGIGRAAVPDSFLLTSTLASFAAARSGHVAAAEILVADLEPHADAFAFTAFTFSGCADHHLGMLLAVLGRLDEADRHLEAAAVRYRESSLPLWEARALRGRAHVVARQARPGARRLREALLQRAEALGTGAAEG